jgi:hypothetical protein
MSSEASSAVCLIGSSSLGSRPATIAQVEMGVRLP